MKKERLDAVDRLEHLVVAWRRKERAFTAADVLDVLFVCQEVRKLRARLRTLEPSCDVCGNPLHGGSSTRVQVGDSPAFVLGDCCEDRPFRVPSREA